MPAYFVTVTTPTNAVKSSSIPRSRLLVATSRKSYLKLF